MKKKQKSGSLLPKGRCFLLPKLLQLWQFRCQHKAGKHTGQQKQNHIGDLFDQIGDKGKQPFVDFFDQSGSVLNGIGDGGVENFRQIFRKAGADCQKPLFPAG